MELLKVENLSFTYKDENKCAIDDVSFNVQKGDFVVICGESGSGKSTLLRLIKRELTPAGKTEGKIWIDEQEQSLYDENDYASKVGYVFQNPDNQIVTDKVWHELVFGMENIGVKQQEMKKRVAEMTAFFGMDGWFERNTATLSGGEKQKLNLAAVIAMKPELLLLDEPISQLDPIAGMELLEIIRQINKEFGITVVVAEHNLDRLMEMADRIIVMEQGKIRIDGKVNEVISSLKVDDHIFEMMPDYIKIPVKLGIKNDDLVSVRNTRQLLMKTYQVSEKIEKQNNVETDNKEKILELKNVFFRYERKERDILSNISFDVKKGEVYSILGNNGSGKTTLLKVIAGIKKQYSGKLIRKAAGCAYMPQNPQTLFVRNTLMEEFREITKEEYKINKIVEFLDLQSLLYRHPYDLSGGEQQKAALGKILLKEPGIILLDEPTKGMDVWTKKEIGKIITDLKNQGITFVIVTHDIEFAARYSSRCAMFFQHEIAAEDRVHEFFENNDFYTTQANRIGRNQFGNVIYAEEIIEACKNGVKK